MTEAQLTRKFLAALQAARPKAVIFKFNDRTTSGIPDACVTYNSRTIWLEFKKYPNKLTPLQKLNIDRLQAVGYAFVVSFNGPQVRVDTPMDFIFLFDQAVNYVCNRFSDAARP